MENSKLIKSLSSVSKTRYFKKKIRENSETDTAKRFEAEFGLFISYMRPDLISEMPIEIRLKNGRRYEIDVLSIFSDVVVIVECKAGNNHSLKNDIAKIYNNTKNIKKYIRENIDKGYEKNIIFICAYNKMNPSQVDYNQARESNIVLIDRKIFDAYLELARMLKESSRDIIFSDWLKNKKIKSIPSKEQNIPAVKGKFSNLDCYHFMSSPYLLKKLCYVHRRHIQHTLGEENISYQRLIKPSKIKSIKKYLEKGNFFPSSVIINFEKEIEFHHSTEKKSEIKSAIPNIKNGYIKPKLEYGSAMVIDGQHRIFGYSGLDERSMDDSLSVIAFSKLDSERQAKMFAEINENQTPINKDVLWDLFEDILPSDNPRYKFSKLVKELNRKSNYFKDNVFIPSISHKGKNHYPLFMNGACRSLYAQKNIFKKLLDFDYKNCFKIIDKFFSFLVTNESLKKDWSAGEDSFILSNNGFEILCMVLNYFYDFLLCKQIDIKNVSVAELERYIEEFSGIIVNSIEEVGLEELRVSLRHSSAAAKKENRDKIIIESGKFSETFKKIARHVYLQNKTEDMSNEFKETLLYDKNRQQYSNDYFDDAILGTICAFINAQVKGELYIGITDDRKQVGIDNELREYFENLDNIKKYIESKINDKIVSSKKVNKGSIEISAFTEDPLILKIFVPKITDCVSFVKGKKPQIFMKTTSGKRKIRNYQELGEKRGAELGTLVNEWLERR
ncbi:MAG: DGQHR domain-containing protein [Promethearchaeota archaeon]